MNAAAAAQSSAYALAGAFVRSGSGVLSLHESS